MSQAAQQAWRGDFHAARLRRTGRTGLGRLGIKIDIAERVINRARNRIEATYDLHEYIDEKREVLTGWAQYLERLRDIP
jgi:hypothetical protein